MRALVVGSGAIGLCCCCVSEPFHLLYLGPPPHSFVFSFFLTFCYGRRPPNRGRVGSTKGPGSLEISQAPIGPIRVLARGWRPMDALSLRRSTNGSMGNRNLGRIASDGGRSPERVGGTRDYGLSQTKSPGTYHRRLSVGQLSSGDRRQQPLAGVVERP